MAWMPGVERVANPYVGKVGSLNAVAVLCHRTYGRFAGDMSVMTGSRKGIAFHFYVSKDGRIFQAADTTSRCAHAKGANDWSIGIEVESLNNDDPMTDRQIASLGRLCGWLSRTHGIPLRYFSSKARAGKRAGFVPHWGVAGSDHGDGWSNDEWTRISARAAGGSSDTPKPPPPVDVPSVLHMSVGDAEATLKRAGLRCVARWTLDGMLAGRVVGQSPKGGKVPPGSVVEVVADKGPAMNVVMWSNQMHVFAVDSGDLMHRWYDGRKWQSESVAGPKSVYEGVRQALTAGDVTAVVEYGTVHCFVGATHAWWDSNTQRWCSERLP